MDFSLGPQTTEFRDQIRVFVAEHLTTEVGDRMHATGTFNDRDLNGALADAGLLAGAVPATATVTPSSSTCCSTS